MTLKLNELNESFSAIPTFVTNVGIAVLILFIGFYFAKWIRSILSKTFKRMEIEVGLRKFLLSCIHIMLYSIVIFAALERIGVSSASIIAVLGSAGLALGLALQGSLSNFAGGVLILLMKPFKVGDYIVCQDSVEGTVTVIGLVYTTLTTADNKTVIIPNGNLSNSTLTNVTMQDYRRVDLTVGISYESDLQKAKEILQAIFSGHELIEKEKPIQIFVHELSQNAVILGARGWVKTEDYWTVKWDVTESVKISFDREAIEIPYQQMDIRINTLGVK